MERAKGKKEDWFWPLGRLDYGDEIRESFPEEAELLGVLTILWNRLELAMQRVFLAVLEPRTPAYGQAIWERQPTHQSKRDLLAVAMETADLNDRQKSVLEQLLDRTKRLADRRNELIHAEYVVHGRTDVLHAKVKSPRSRKQAKHQKLSAPELSAIIQDLEQLIQMMEAAQFELLGPEAKAKHDILMAELSELAPRRGTGETSK